MKTIYRKTIAGNEVELWIDAHKTIVKRNGKNEYLGLCPFHKENTPSFTVLADFSKYHCFGCREQGFLEDDVAFREYIENSKPIDLKITQLDRLSDEQLKGLLELVSDKKIIRAGQRTGKTFYLKKRRENKDMN